MKKKKKVEAMAASHEVEPYRPYGCKTDWKRFLKAGEELTRGQLLLSADHKSKAVRKEESISSFYYTLNIENQCSN